MKKLLILGCVLFVSCGAPQLTNVNDCGEGTYSIASGDKDYTTVQSCILQGWTACEATLGSLTTYTQEGDPIVTTYHVRPSDPKCSVEVVSDGTKDRFGSGEITTEICTQLNKDDSTPVAYLAHSECN